MNKWAVQVPGAELAVFEYGKPDAETTVLLVHGYPDDHHVFDPLIGELGDSVRIIAYDTRGGGDTVVDDGLVHYSIERLAADAFAVLDSIPDRAGPVHVLAHDWGSVQMWEAMASPRARTAFASFVSVSGPSLDHMREVSRNRLVRPGRWLSLVTQLGRSWYIWGFHLPIVGTRVPQLFSSLGSEDSPDPQKDNQRRGIALYRANIVRRLLSGPSPRCEVPTTVVVPLKDRFLSADLANGLDQWIPDLRVVEVDAQHWWPYTHPADAAAVLTSRV
ncbi:MAG: alpha/beta fold hydrolase [Rhodococcus sp. (in: high G+C Gram-positive bacteria)]